MKYSYYASTGREKTWKGHSARIRAALAEGSMSTAELAEQLELTESQVVHACAQMAMIQGGVLFRDGKWRLWKHEPKGPRREASAKFAGPITIGRGFKWGAGLA